MIETRLLRQFIAVAEELHFRRAAERLHMAQPPLSQAIRRLEQAVGYPLFERSQRAVALTAAGQAFLLRARETLAVLEEGVAHARRVAQGVEGHLSIGLINLGGYPGVWAALGAFRRAAPTVQIRLVEATTREQVQLLEQGEIDLGFMRTPGATTPGLSLETILREPIYLALPQDHPLASEQSVPLQAVRDEPFVASPRALGQGFHDQMLELCQAAGFVPHVVQRARQMHTVLGLVASGFGVALVPASLARGNPDGVVLRPLDCIAPSRLLGLSLEMAWQTSCVSPVRDRLIEQVRLYSS